MVSGSHIDQAVHELEKKVDRILDAVMEIQRILKQVRQDVK